MKKFTFNNILVGTIWLMCAALLTMTIKKNDNELHIDVQKSNHISSKSQPGKPVSKILAFKIRKAMPGTKVESIISTPVANLYQIKAGNNIFYTDQSGHYLVVGHLYDMRKRIDLTQQVKNKLLSAKKIAKPTRKIPWTSLPLEAAVRYGNPKGKKIAIFHDPDCPYCTKLSRELVKSKEYDVYQIMYPITSLHSGAYKKSEKILCDYKKISAKQCDMGKVLKKASSFAKNHGINGTPTIIVHDGRVIPGYRTHQQLAKLIKQ